MDPSESSRSGRRLVFLGTGTSSGVPMIGCQCSVCTSTDPRNQRTRPSVLVELAQGKALIDTTPELRLQMLRERVKSVDAIVYTHAHADHLFGLDDARIFSKYLQGPIPVFCEEEVEEAIRKVFSYAFGEHAARIGWGGVPKIAFRRITPGAGFSLLGETWLPLRLEHGRFRVLGFRIGDLAYCTDVSRIPAESRALLEGLDTLILDALRLEPHPTHFSLDEALEEIAAIKPRRAYLTHLSHGLDHQKVESRLPEGVRLAYDGLAIAF